MSPMTPSAKADKIERLSRDIQDMQEEARRISYELSAVRNRTENGWEWEVTFYGKKVHIRADDFLRLAQVKENASSRELFKELVAWKIRSLSI
ncbi:hypothetical protein F4V43_03340 [Paenibacillus spiritus]|uniref:Uncharacterized protein n=1 Tax=Paenibacillus spiritus TaxID=2496557 RepID=A0A5J5GIL4_9BACL|nr:hypothetical protein [Paenibacillus spiritus]KAA9007538.1 hypothetical protein F4V43_03340 [Paenibacillus spiritus]